jgi:hypothetical protein
MTELEKKPIDSVITKYFEAESYCRAGKRYYKEGDFETSHILLGTSLKMLGGDELREYKLGRELAQSIEPMFQECRKKTGRPLLNHA